jgi:hypothetical protein
MRSIKARLLFVLVIISLATLHGFPQRRAKHAHPPDPQDQADRDQESRIQDRDLKGNGIFVDQPKVYDDASLQIMLNAARSRLASLQTFDQTGLLSRIGAITGATIQQSGIAAQVSGPPVPQSVVTASSNPSTVTTNPSITPPAATVPTGVQFSAPSGFSVSSLNALNEMMQLTSEIANLQLLLEGSLTDRFVANVKTGQATGQVKARTTLGFSVALSPGTRYKDAIAVVEVELERPLDVDPNQKNTLTFSEEAPAITALLPREKTYNVASITDHMVSIGGGVATQVISGGFSWLRGRKTYYLVQDQDTVALTIHDDDPKKRTFAWQFRPVLGQPYVQTGLKQTFVQVASPVTPISGCFGRVNVTTYWREFDRKHGLVRQLIPGTTRTQQWPIPVFDKTPYVKDVAYEDLGSGQILVRVDTRRPIDGTYIRVGNNYYNQGSPGFTLEDYEIRFVASATDIAKNRAYIVTREGQEEELRGPLSWDLRPSALTIPCDSPLPPIPAPPPRLSPLIQRVFASPYDDNSSLLTVKLTGLSDTGIDPGIDEYLLYVGDRVFGLSDAPIERIRGSGPNTAYSADIKAIVPNSLLAGKKVTVFALFWGDQGYIAPKYVEKVGLDTLQYSVALLSQNKDGSARYLFYGTHLENAFIVAPPGVQLIPIPGVNDQNVRTFYLKADEVAAYKQVAVQKAYGQRPVLLPLPALSAQGVTAATPPKPKERPVVGADSALIGGDGMDKLKSVTFKAPSATQPVKIKFSVTVDKKSVNLMGLVAAGVTVSPGQKELQFQFESGQPIKVILDVVNYKVESVDRAQN